MLTHTCRDEGYCPYTAPCKACMAQLSRNGWLLRGRTTPGRTNQLSVR